jgi:hypothetical protein
MAILCCVAQKAASAAHYAKNLCLARAELVQKGNMFLILEYFNASNLEKNICSLDFIP